MYSNTNFFKAKLGDSIDVKVKDKYSGSMDALENMISQGMENPEADIDTTGLDEYINIAKKSKIGKELDELASDAVNEEKAE